MKVLAVFAAAAMLAFMMGVTSAWAVDGLALDQNESLAAASSAQVATAAAKTTYLCGSGKACIFMSGSATGKATYDAKTKTLTLNNFKGSAGTYIQVNLPGKSIKLNLVGKNSLDAIYSYASMTVQGAGSVIADVDVFSGGLVMAKGKIGGDVNVVKGNVVVRGGMISGALVAEAGNVSMLGGTVKGGIDCRNGKFALSKGVVMHTSASMFAVNAKNIAMTGGTIASTGQDYGIAVRGVNGKAGNFVLKGGTVKIADPQHVGLSVTGGNLSMSGGTLYVANVPETAICVEPLVKGKTSVGGKIRITGGKVTARTTDTKNYYGVYAVSMVNKPAYLKSIGGMLPTGASFKVGKNQYKVANVNNARVAMLVKYGNASAKATVNVATYGRVGYFVTQIAAGAFNTSAGHKVTNIVVKSELTKIGKNAFAKTKALKKLTFEMPWWKRVYSNDGKLTSVVPLPGVSVAKKAFAQCGKGGGSGLTVTFVSGVGEKEAPQFASLLRSRGMSKSATLKVY